MIWETASAQSIGGRSTQEDAFAVVGEDGRTSLVLAVADGAGGHAAGERASQAAIAHVRAQGGTLPRDAAGARPWLEKVVRGANAGVVALGGEGVSSPRTTIVVAWLGADRALVAHVGDSRLYQFRNGRQVFRTSDHSVVQILLDLGRISEDEARSHPDRSRLLKALGGGEEIAVEVVEIDIRPGDSLALCSDGVWDHVGTDEIGAALQALDLDAAAGELVARAVARGGADADNATLLLARLSGQQAS